MKTEFETTKEKIIEYLRNRCLETELPCRQHKEDSQRFLEFLESLVEKYEPNIIWNMPIEMKNRITDLKNAIKLYEENGI